MHSTAEPESPTRVRLDVEVPFTELDPRLQTASRDDFAGFRSGRLPVQSIDRCGNGTPLSQEAQDAVLALVAATAREHGIVPLGRSDVEIVDCGDGTPLRLTFGVEVRPSVSVPALSSLVVSLRPDDVGQPDADAFIAELRDHFATLAEVDRPAAPGDVVRLSVALRADKPGTHLSYQLGSGHLLVDVHGHVVTAADELVIRLDAVLTGLAAGDRAAVSLPASASAEAAASVAVLSVHERRLPPVDDNFAANVGSFDNVAELRAELHARANLAVRSARMYAVRQAVLAAVLAATPMTAPDGHVRDEVAHRKQWMLSELRHRGITLAEYLAASDRTEQDIDDELHATTVDRVRTQLLLDAIADAEDIQATDEERNHELALRARRAGVDPQTYHQRLAATGALADLAVDARRSRTLATVIRQVRFTDANGAPVRTADLLGAGGAVE